MSHLHHFLKSNGFKPELKNRPDQFEKEIYNYLGKKEGTKYFNYIDKLKGEGKFSEEGVVDKIGSDINLLKLVYSTQIEISIQILERYIEIIGKVNIYPKSVIDIGGANGWAIKYLSDLFLWDSDNYVIDRNINWDKLKNIEYYNQGYTNHSISKKFDFYISILGATGEEDINSLLKFIQETSEEEFIAFLCLRIATEKEFLKIIENINKLGFQILFEYSKPIIVDDEKFPVLVLKKQEKNDSVISDKLYILRNVFKGYEIIKRIYGYEAELFLKLIEDGEVIENYDFNELTGEDQIIKILKKNDILYRIYISPDKYVLIDYPIVNNTSDEYDLLHEIFSIPWKNTL